MDCPPGPLELDSNSVTRPRIWKVPCPAGSPAAPGCAAPAVGADGWVLLVFLHDQDGAHHRGYCGYKCEEGPERPRGRAKRIEDAKRVGGESDEHQEPLERRQPEEYLPVDGYGLCHHVQGAAEHVEYGNDGHHQDQETPSSGPSAQSADAELRRNVRLANDRLVTTDS